MGKILIIEDDVDISNLIKTYLEQAHFEVITTTSPVEGIEILNKHHGGIELVVLDLALPEMDGLEVCQQIRQDSRVPIIISTARGDIYNKIQGFDKGADDYLSKPYEPVELIARINALLRRIKPRESSFGALRIDTQKREAYLHDEPIDLTNTEFDILALLIDNRLHPISRESISNTISTIRDDSSLRNVDTHIRNLRIKLKDDAKEPKFLQSVWGIGYKFCV